ncbi:hypothetical protein E3A20_08900 [Planctomyces bekefii]|uniref:Heme exporter protein B n=1 Tax=Planctomyces bekefii TaxID=1653850 RepID=A0A5C6M7B3_9PLAN|nr:hypothetical protein E3A20_08900 [Planctomyces bekefii]
MSLGRRQFSIILTQGIKAELADLERLISPVLFAITMLLLFAFAIGEVDETLRAHMYLAETFLTLFFALQLAFSRLFEPDRQDRVFDMMRSYPVSHTSWFLAKYILVIVMGLTTLIPTMLFGAFINQTARTPLFSWSVLGIASLALAGLAALGVLLSALTLKATARQMLYPLIYFPLTTPVLLAAVQASLTVMEKSPDAGLTRSWLGLLLAFDVIYLTLGILLYSELVDEG